MARIRSSREGALLHIEASRRDFLRMLALTGGATAVTAFLSSCGGGGTNPATTSPPAASGSAPPRAASPRARAGGSAAAGASPTQTGAKLASNQVLRLWNIEPQHADPNTAASGNEVRVVMAMFDGLLTFDRDGKAIPLVAEKWDIS